MSDLPSYTPIHPARSERVTVRDLPYHVLIWGDLSHITPDNPLLLMVHGWMDVAASFQFMVDELRAQPGWATRPIVAVDWRGFGQTPPPPATDSYFFADYLGDLDGLVHALSPDQPIDLLGHSMGGNVVMMYAGIRPARIRRLVNLDGFGMAATAPDQAADRYVKWLDEIRTPTALKTYDSREAVAARLRGNNPRLREDYALWLAGHWAREEGGCWRINADPVHKRPHPFLYRVEEVLSLWGRIACPTLMLEGRQTDYFSMMSGRYTHEEFCQRIQVVPNLQRAVIEDAGHMLHHDQPAEVAHHVARHLALPSAPGA
ncbi:MAG TPA: alpha/beta hydrolase [Aquabacterium sp.]|nr:alpha/beta hydrolase [Aquabacterium sp.]